MSTVAIVILNYNGKNYLKQFLPTLKKHSNGHQIIVADNQSTDDSVSFLTNHHQDIKRIILSENFGYSEGYNRALQQIEADYYVLLNSDIEVTENWVEPVITLMDQNPDIAACQPKLLSYEERDRFEYAGAAGGFVDLLGYPFCRGRIFDSIESDMGQYNDNREIFWATGACLFIRATAFFEAGGLDPHYFAHMEEIDLCWRLKRMGLRIFYCGESQVYHVGGGTLPKANPFKTYLNFRNSLITLYKNSAASELLWKIPARWLLDVVAAIRFLGQTSFRDFWAVVRAHMTFLTHILRIEGQRKAVLKLGKTMPLHEMYKGSVVAAYFLKNAKIFSDLKF